MSARNALLAAAALTGGILAGQSGLTSLNNDSIEGTLKEMQLTAKGEKDEDGTTTFVFQLGETTVQLFQYPMEKGLESLSLNAGFDLEGKADVEKVNKFNFNRRFGKATIDEEGDVYLVMDLDMKAGFTRDQLKQGIARFKSLLPAFDKEVLN